MNRKDFLKVCSLLGISIPAIGLISSCESQEKNKNLNISTTNDSDVLIIGAGAAGLSAAFLLKRRGVTVRILEAKDSAGGRMKIDRNFADFPLNYGAEWLSKEGWQQNELQNIANKPSEKLNFKLLEDFPDQKFYRYSWFDFFNDYVASYLKNEISYKNPVTQIDYRGSKVIVTNHDGNNFYADKVIVTTPPSILKSKKINFIPAFAKNKLDTLEKINFWGGFRAFVKLKNPIGCHWEEMAYNLKGQKIFYDATWKQNSKYNIVGIIAIGNYAKSYQEIDKQNLKEHILAELDIKYNNRATSNFLDITHHNWSQDRFAMGSYVSDFQPNIDFKGLSENIENKVYFAGDSYVGGNLFGKVHIAAKSGKDAVDEILKSS